MIATEIGMAMARRGHRVHFIAYDVPRRLDRFTENIFYHEVEVPHYPLFPHAPYSIGLASKMVEVGMYEPLDLFHVHYAVPHATSAFLAKQVLGEKSPKIITTLHGTDITLVGNDRSYLPITRFSIIQSDRVTAPSEYLKHATYDKLNVSSSTKIDVIPNFVDTTLFSPCEDSKTPLDLSTVLRPCRKEEYTLVHVSNFRPVKRVTDVIKMFALVRKKIPSHLLLIGDGPDRSQCEGLARELGIAEHVCFLGKQETFAPILQSADLFILPSASESFGLAALEAMSCGVPVIASNTQGIPEVVIDGKVGLLSDVGDVEKMAEDAVKLLRDTEMHKTFATNARNMVVEKYSSELIIPRFEQCYFETLEK